MLPSPLPMLYRYSLPNPCPVFEDQSCRKVASWLRSIAQKNALCSACPRSVEDPYVGIRMPVARSSFFVG